MPDFLCEDAINNEEIKVVWEGTKKTENTLYFASRTDLKFKKELAVIQDIFKSKMKSI